jgi:hypothetical protein
MVILACGAPPAPGGTGTIRQLAQRVARGSTVVFLFVRLVRDADWQAIRARPASWMVFL